MVAGSGGGFRKGGYLLTGSVVEPVVTIDDESGNGG